MNSTKPKEQQFKNRRRNFVVLFVLILGLEFYIATSIKNTFIRTVLGDFFVVILLYSIVRAITGIHRYKVAAGVLIFAYLIEFSQWIHVVEILDIKRNFYIDLILGTSFDWKDLMAYTMGIMLVIIIDNFSIKKGKQLTENGLQKIK